MERMTRNVLVLGGIVMFLLVAALSPVSAGESIALMGVKSVKAMFDVRSQDPQHTAIGLDLIYGTYKDLEAMGKEPKFAVVFMGPAVKLISKNRDGFRAEDQKYLDQIAATITKMSNEGIELEICLFAANLLGVDPGSVLPEIIHVKNGWISEIGFQSQGYSLVPVY